MKEVVKKVLKSSAIGRILYEPLHKLYRLYSVPHRRRMLMRHGPEVLKDLAEVFKRHGMPAYAIYGTLLGFVRDGGFMPHDDDIDIAVLPGTWKPSRVLKTMLDEGFEYIFGFAYDGELDLVKLSWKGIPIDFFFYEDDGKNFYERVYYYQQGEDYPNANANTVYRLPQIRHSELTTVRVCGVDFPIPKDYEAECEDHYGPGWRVPDPGFVGERNPRLVRLPNYGFSISKEEALALNS